MINLLSVNLKLTWSHERTTRSVTGFQVIVTEIPVVHLHTRRSVSSSGEVEVGRGGR